MKREIDKKGPCYCLRCYCLRSCRYGHSRGETMHCMVANSLAVKYAIPNF